VDELLEVNGIPKELASALMDILPLINRAVQGELMRGEDAEKIGQSGIQMLWNLNDIYQGIVYHPIEKTIISSEESNSTVIPYVENPIKNVYIWSHDELYDYLSDLSDIAEFPVSIEKIG
jgi:hypothetical protein